MQKIFLRYRVLEDLGNLMIRSYFTLAVSLTSWVNCQDGPLSIVISLSPTPYNEGPSVVVPSERMICNKRILLGGSIHSCAACIRHVSRSSFAVDGENDEG